MRSSQVLQILRLGRRLPMPPALPEIESKINKKSVSKKRAKQCAKVVPTDSHADPHGRQNSAKIMRKVTPKCLSEKKITKVVHPRPFRMHTDLQSEAPARAGASFSLSPLSRKSAPKVVPLVPFWEVFGHQNRIKSAKEAFKKIIGKSM